MGPSDESVGPETTLGYGFSMGERDPVTGRPMSSRAEESLRIDMARAGMDATNPVNRAVARLGTMLGFPPAREKVSHQSVITAAGVPTLLGAAAYAFGELNRVVNEPRGTPTGRVTVARRPTPTIGARAAESRLGAAGRGGESLARRPSTLDTLG